MSDDERSTNFDHLALVLVVLGSLLIATSFASFSFLAKRVWTSKDSEAFAQVTRDLHSATLTPPRSSVDSQLYWQKLQGEYDRLNSKLAAAQNEPRRWSRWLLGTGIAMTAAGALVQLSQRNK
jgi:hypothetical protein